MEKYSKTELKELLDSLEARYNNSDFVECDPIYVPYGFDAQGDREIAGFLVSLIAWGNRKAILKSGKRMMERMDGAPLDFIVNGTERDFKRASDGFVHRTFSGADFGEMLRLLHEFYKNHGSLGDYFQSEFERVNDLRSVLNSFRCEMLSCRSIDSVTRHISSIEKGSACKRLCMYLRWMVRNDNKGVDMGLWTRIPTSALYIPLDVHSARQGRNFGLLSRNANDWKSVEQLTASLREFDPNDPVKYDFALFGLGAMG